MTFTRLLAMAAFLSPLVAATGFAQETKPGFAVPEGVTFRAADIISEGTRMSAEVFAPAGSEGKRLPTIVMSHGWGGTAEHLRPTAIAFAKAGYLAITFDYRGWGKSDARLILAGARPEKKDGKLIAEVKEVREVVDPIDQTADILNAIHWAAGDGQCDPARIGLWGSSYSGGHVVYVAARDPRVKAFVSQVGAMDSRWTIATAAARAHTFAQGTARTQGKIGYPPPGSRFLNMNGQPVWEKLMQYAADRGHRPLQGLREAIPDRRERGAVRQQVQRDPRLRAGHGRQEARDDPGHQALRHLQRGPRPGPEGGDRLVRRAPEEGEALNRPNEPAIAQRGNG